MNLPEWYRSSTADCDIPITHRRVGGNKLSVRRALASIGETLAIELSGANRSESWLCSIEPRAKVVGILVMIFGATLLKGLLPIAILLSIAVALAASSRITFKRLGRLWLGVPLFTMAIVLPAILNIVTPGSAVLVLLRFRENAQVCGWNLPSSLTVTYPGMIIAGRFILRSVACITLTAVLVSSTDSSVLVNALRRLGMPRVFGMTLAMMQRYTSLILRTAEEIHLAKLSRTVSSRSIRDEQRWVAAGVGVLFYRTHCLAEGVRQAMVSRGYDGDLQVRRVHGMRLRDRIWIAAILLIVAGMLLMDHIL